MTGITKIQFEAALAEAGVPSWAEPRVENDGEYGYECFDDNDGNEIGFISYRSGAIVGYTVHGR